MELLLARRRTVQAERAKPEHEAVFTAWNSMVLRAGDKVGQERVCRKLFEIAIDSRAFVRRGANSFPSLACRFPGSGFEFLYFS